MFPLPSPKLLLILGCVVVVGGLVAWASTLPESWREEGREEQRSEYKIASDAAVAASALKLSVTESELTKARMKNERIELEHDRKFNDYVADVRAGRVDGLRVRTTNICPSRSQEATSPLRVIEDQGTRLPREIEEGLFAFADDRDKIILDFEAFKAEVRTAECFAVP